MVTSEETELSVVAKKVFGECRRAEEGDLGVKIRVGLGES